MSQGGLTHHDAPLISHPRLPRHSCPAKVSVHRKPVVLPALHLHTSQPPGEELTPVPPPNRRPPHTTRCHGFRIPSNAARRQAEGALTSRRAAEQEISAILSDIEYYNVGTRHQTLTPRCPIVSGQPTALRTCSRGGTDVTRCQECTAHAMTAAMCVRTAAKFKWLKKHLMKRSANHYEVEACVSMAALRTYAFDRGFLRHQEFKDQLEAGWQSKVNRVRPSIWQKQKMANGWTYGRYKQQMKQDRVMKHSLITNLQGEVAIHHQPVSQEDADTCVRRRKEYQVFRCLWQQQLTRLCRCA